VRQGLIGAPPVSVTTATSSRRRKGAEVLELMVPPDKRRAGTGTEGVQKRWMPPVDEDEADCAFQM
jgi:hypothetical protein